MNFVNEFVNEKSNVPAKVSLFYLLKLRIIYNIKQWITRRFPYKQLYDLKILKKYNY